MKKISGFILLLFLPFVSAHSSALEPYKMPRTEVVPIQHSGTDRQYELYVRLPEGYADNPDKKYPVIYVADAVWHMEMLAGATEYLMPDVIVVGISWQTNLGYERAHASRFRDYSIVESSNAEHQAKYQFGNAGDHLSFIRDQVIPYVESEYRTNPEERVYFGYSLSGTFGTYILFEQPDTFKHYVLGSPTPQIEDFVNERKAKMTAVHGSLNPNVFVAIGEQEQNKMEMTEGFSATLNETGLSFAGLEVIENSDHGTAFPETAIRAVKWLSQLTAE